MTPAPDQPETCSPLDLSSADLARRIERLRETTVNAIEGNGYYSEAAKAAAVREVTALINNVLNQCTLARAEATNP